MIARRISIFNKRLLAFALSALAGATVAGCVPAVMYGPPVPDYEVKGKVTQTNGTPIDHIHVTAYDSNSAVILNAYSSLPDGAYSSDLRYSAGGKVTITATDEDGPLNGGQFATSSQTVDLPPAEAGKTRTSEVNFTLEPKP